MKTLILNAIENLFHPLNDKTAFNIINGGWEKYFEIELAYKLSAELKDQNKIVAMQDNRADISILDKSTSEKTIIEIGHYTFNQPYMTELNFKPKIDFLKRKEQYKANMNIKNFIHIQLLEFVNFPANSYP